MESLIDSFQGNSKTHIIICVNNIGKYSLETNQYLRDAIHSKNINTNPYPLKVFIYYKYLYIHTYPFI